MIESLLGYIIGGFSLIAGLSVMLIRNVDTELFATLVRKVSVNQGNIDEKIEPFLDRPLAQLDVIEHVILSIAAFELLNSIEVPHQVVIDEAVNLAKQFGAEQGHAYINGVLDKAARKWRDPASFSPFDR